MLAAWTVEEAVVEGRAQRRRLADDDLAVLNQRRLVDLAAVPLRQDSQYDPAQRRVVGAIGADDRCAPTRGPRPSS